MDRLTASEGVRLCAALAQCEIALVRRDAVAPALLSQAARHARGRAPAPLVEAAATLARESAGRGADEAAAAAARKVTQALCRAAVGEVDAALLERR